MERFPTVNALADASVDEVLSEWEGLGYYSRARNLPRGRASRADSQEGAIPDTVDGLRELPGIGEYTAGAVASIAFDRPEPAVDVNARRVLSASSLQRCRPRSCSGSARASSFRSSAPATSIGRSWSSERRYADRGRRAAPNVRSPRDAWRESGERRRRARERSVKRPVPSFDLGVAVVLSPRGRALVVRRPDRGMLGRLWEFPSRAIEEGELPAAAAARAIAALAPHAEPIRR